MKIQPCIGLDETLFGMTQDQVRALNGEPDEVAEDRDDGITTVAWYYWARSLSFNFDSDVEMRLMTIEIGADDATLAGQAVIGLSLRELQDFLRTQGLEGTEFDIDDEDGGYVTVDAWNMNFWIEDDYVTDAQWEAPLDDEGIPLWP
ncbi:MAG: hypothetical protein KDB53_00910 [Planctomycetes bacterium]|nr:hypothetical protein [Planctomycetota bacterium]